MTTTHDDMPHPVPPIAYLRYKENWFFLIMDRDHDVFGAIHVVTEPGFERIRFACHLRVHGELFAYQNEQPFPVNFAFSPELGDGRFSVRFVKAHEQIDLRIQADDFDLDVSFRNRAPLFDFAEYDHANPEAVSLQEISNFATNQLYVHQQQGMTTHGSVVVGSGPLAGRTFGIDGMGYRDHSRAVRCDNIVHKHIWTGLNFPRHVFGVMTLTTSLRPEVSASTGYVFDSEHGLRPLRAIEFIEAGDGPDGLPATVEIRMTDIYDRPFTVTADLTNRHSHVPLHSEKPGATPYVYDIVENFAPLQLKETGDIGIGLVEMGWSTPTGS